jgi:FAD/FMN-containing dehydrogenase
LNAASRHETPDGVQAREVVEELRRKLRGDVLTPGTPEYEHRRPIWNGMFDDATPTAIVRCLDARDCAAAIGVVSERDILLAVRGGGHHVAGFGTCDGIVLDLGAMRSVTVDESRGLVRVGGGCTLRDVDAATSAVGCAVPLGVVSETGVGGLALSGGIGWRSRAHGFTSDNLLSARVVTAAGEIVTASETENADLLWGLRGGGGNFGAVTEFTFAMHPVDVLTVAESYHVCRSAEDVEALLRFFADWGPGLPNHVNLWLAIEPYSPYYHSKLPAEAASGLVASFLACSAAAGEDAEQALAPLLTEGTPLASGLSAMRLIDLQRIQDDSGSARRGMQTYMKSEAVTRLTDSMISGVADHMLRLPNDSSLFELGLLGGALAERDDMHSAAGMRNAQHLAGFIMMAGSKDGLEEHIAWARSGWATLQEGTASGGGYLNFDSASDDDRRVVASMSSASLSKKWVTLRELKRRWDPENLFRLNHNVRPAD